MTPTRTFPQPISLGRTGCGKKRVAHPLLAVHPMEVLQNRTSKSACPTKTCSESTSFAVCEACPSESDQILDGNVEQGNAIGRKLNAMRSYTGSGRIAKGSRTEFHIHDWRKSCALNREVAR